VSAPTSNSLAERSRRIERRTSGALGQVLGDPLAAFAVVLVILLAAAALFADFLCAYDPIRIAPPHRFLGPSLAHPFGTDQLGRDLLARMLHGGRIAFLVAAVSIGASLVLGILLGLLAGCGPRWLDSALLLVFDAIRSFPSVMLALALATVFGPSLATVIMVVVLFATPAYARIIRTQTLVLKEAEFVLASVSIGAGLWRVIMVHILLNIIGPIMILASMDVPVAITIEAGMSFLGFGVRPPTPSWGSILNDGYAFIRESGWIAAAGGLPIVLTTLGFTFLGEALRDAIDPKLRKAI
jgi:peptide/nickel transport system permease protein